MSPEDVAALVRKLRAWNRGPYGEMRGGYSLFREAADALEALSGRWTAEEIAREIVRRLRSVEWTTPTLPVDAAYMQGWFTALEAVERIGRNFNHDIGDDTGTCEHLSHGEGS